MKDPTIFTLPTLLLGTCGKRNGPKVMNVTEIDLLLSECSAQESRPCIWSGQHIKAEFSLGVLMSNSLGYESRRAEPALPITLVHDTAVRIENTASLPEK